MGLRTQLSLSWDDADYVKGSLHIDQVIAAAAVFVTEQNWSEDVLSDLRANCDRDGLGEPSFNSVGSYGVIGLIQSISAQIPDVTFYAKGSGEEPWDIWTREFKAGTEQLARGPFDEDAPPIPEALLEQARAAHAAAMERKAGLEKARRPAWLSKLFG